MLILAVYMISLFTSGTDEHGKAYIVEWQVRNGERKVKRSFRGLNEYSGHLHFDLNKNSILAAGYNHQIKFWDIDNGNPLGVSIADGNLPDVPLIKFNKDGSLLAWCLVLDPSKKNVVLFCFGS
ncbi:hypothetical protein DCAR_0206998 [Daucus carota subsp. sativus]|uniref:Anaphase-promoting complex subunit 4 WD40 domain-containing protein n=1 Tax=Daucus carota subsp. sativus TaxID=79200 RepID=A0AAF1AP70_DAUCS|nr:hypothetical protein DCAR_0206998 [Daucus carota subsp. sativus]